MVPRYGTATLAEVVPSLLAGLGVPGFANTLGVPDVTRVCLLLVDGLGFELLRDHPADAPFLHNLIGGSQPLTAGFPATTATSITSIGTGRSPGEHGIVGYTFATPERLLHVLRWSEVGGGDLRESYPPETMQPEQTALEEAAAAGVRVRVAMAHKFRNSGLSRVALRGGEVYGTIAFGDLAASAREWLTGPGPALCYAYHADLDMLGHWHGPDSAPWRYQLAAVDRLAASIGEDLPAGSALAVIADHGMVPITDRIDVDSEPDLLAGVRLLGGDVRVRHVYTEPGADGDVTAAWQAAVGTRAWVVSREEAVAAGWFGKQVADRVLPRIGDLVVATYGTTGIVRSAVEPLETGLAGNHGSLTAQEQLVPFLLHVG